jgi:hypothetical protein
MQVGVFVCGLLAAGAHAQGSNVTVVYPPPESPPDVIVIRARPVQEPPRQVTYMIAFKDDVVRLADQYWVNGNTLYYVTADHHQMTAALNSVDRTLSEQLNAERNVTFSLPAGQEKAITQAHVVHHTASSVGKRCCCTSTGAATHAGSAARAGK